MKSSVADVLAGAKADLEARIGKLDGKDPQSAGGRSALAGCLNVIDAAMAQISAHAGNGAAQ